MTTNKAQKRAIRSRMSKTGERYTSARHFQLDLHRVEAPAEPPKPVLPPRVAEPGMSDSAIQRGSGRTWDEWFTILDAWGGTTRGHTAIARHVAEEFNVDGWWAQGVTVGYERARGLRAVNERPDGFSTNASRTFPVSVERLFDAVVNQPSDVLVRTTARKPRTANFKVADNGTRVSATFTARGPNKSAVQLQQTGLPDREAVATWRARLKAYLDEVGETLRNS